MRAALSHLVASGCIFVALDWRELIRTMSTVWGSTGQRRELFFLSRVLAMVRTTSPGRPGLARADPDDVNRLDFNGAVSTRLKGWKNHVTLYSWDYYYLIAPAVSEKGMFIIKRDCGASCN